jgi:uncharacterized protein YhfF
MNSKTASIAVFLDACRDALGRDFPAALRAEGLAMRRLGNTAALCERLIGYIIARDKTGVFSQPADFASGKLPQPGEYAVLIDFDDRPRCLVRYDECAVIPFSAIGPEHVAIETPALRDVVKFRAFHRNYWTPILEARGERFDEDAPVVFQRFTCLYPPRPEQ